MTRRLVVADTGPLNYLVLIGTAHVLPRLFERIFLPVTVHDELAASGAPSAVRNWIASPPTWLEIRDDVECAELDVAPELDAGERAALALARVVSADLFLMGDRAGVAAARRLGLRVTGTLGVLDLAAQRNLIDLGAVVARLRATNFRIVRKSSMRCSHGTNAEPLSGPRRPRLYRTFQPEHRAANQPRSPKVKEATYTTKGERWLVLPPEGLPSVVREKSRRAVCRIHSRCDTPRVDSGQRTVQFAATHRRRAVEAPRWRSDRAKPGHPPKLAPASFSTG